MEEISLHFSMFKFASGAQLVNKMSDFCCAVLDAAIGRLIAQITIPNFSLEKYGITRLRKHRCPIVSF
jgi:hypothetical protein